MTNPPINTYDGIEDGVEMNQCDDHINDDYEEEDDVCGNRNIYAVSGILVICILIYGIA